MPRNSVSRSLGPLYDVVAKAFPRHRTENKILDVLRLADDLGMTGEGVYKWFMTNQLPAVAAVKLIRFRSNRDRLNLYDLLRYIPK